MKLKLEVSPAGSGKFWYMFYVNKYEKNWFEHRDGDYPAIIYDDVWLGLFTALPAALSIGFLVVEYRN